jgi:predicted amidohydrolase
MVQVSASTDKAANSGRMRRLLAGAATHRPNLVVFPEAFMHDFGDPGTKLTKVAEPLDGPFVTSMAELARTYRFAIVAGMFERAEDEELVYNTVVAVDANGDIAGCYRKIHLYDSFGNRESDRLRGGDLEPVVASLAGMQVGLLTCYDLRFPELSRLLVEQGAELVCVPAAWVRGPLKEDHWETLLRARAIENTCFYAGAGQCGPSYVGRSMVVDPMGVVISALGSEEGLAIADIDREALEAVRERNPALQHIRFGVVPR